jgi:hypothetical protein
LRNDESLAPDIEQRGVELTCVVREDPQADELVGHPLSLDRGVAARDTEQDDDAGADLADATAVDRN